LIGEEAPRNAGSFFLAVLRWISAAMKTPPPLAWFALATMLAGLTACGTAGIPRPPSLDLPQPVRDLRAVRKGDRVFLAWTIPSQTTDGQNIRHVGPTEVCRSKDTPALDCSHLAGEFVATAVQSTTQNNPGTGTSANAAKPKADFVDNLPSAIFDTAATSELFYAVSAQNEKRHSAGTSNIVSVPALRSVPPPSDFQAQVTAQGVVLHWTPSDHPAPSLELQYEYRVYRRADGESTDVVAGELPIESPASEIVDHSFEWEKNYSYRCTVVTVIHVEGKPDSQFEGDDTPEVRVFAHDVFPPAVPGGLQAVYSGAGQQSFIDLIWAPDTDADLAGYNVYRSDGGRRAKVNSAPIQTSAYRDSDVVSGKTYTYSVTGVDVRGNESKPSSDAIESVP
jgi:hypothetical protein